MKRRNLGKGLGMGYKNLVPMDSHIHSLSAKGFKSNTSLYGKIKMSKKEMSLYASGITEEHKEEAVSVVQELKKQGKWEEFKANTQNHIANLKKKGYSTGQAIQKWRKEHSGFEGLVAGSGVALGLIALGLPLGATAVTVGAGVGTGYILGEMK